MTLFHARSFFWEEIGANQLYLGNGVNISGYLEYLMENKQIRTIKGLAFVDFKITMAEVE